MESLRDGAELRAGVDGVAGSPRCSGRKGCAGPCRLSGLLSCAAAERFDDGVANFEARFGVVATGLLAAEVVLALGA